MVRISARSANMLHDIDAGMSIKLVLVKKCLKALFRVSGVMQGGRHLTKMRYDADDSFHLRPTTGDMAAMHYISQEDGRTCGVPDSPC